MQFEDTLSFHSKTLASSLLCENNMPTNDDGREVQKRGSPGINFLVNQDDLFWFLFYKTEKQLSYLPLVFGIFCYMQQ